MKRRSPVFTPLGWLLSLVLFLGLGISLLRSGGRAFSPGPLSAFAEPGEQLAGFNSHAEFEGQCSRCHQPLRTIQAELCMDCHQDLRTELSNDQGFHAGLQNRLRCFDCHLEHRGRDFDPLTSAYHRFDHASATGFSLVWHQVDYQAAPMQCAACHPQARQFEASPRPCRDCHAGQDPAFIDAHIREAGGQCIACHDGFDRMRSFNHALTTGVVLEGGHAQANCAGCHEGGRFSNLPQECAGCHGEPDMHAGLFSTDCASCHTVQGWSPALLDGAPFRHFEQTGFSLARHTLDYAEEPLTCQGCHTESLSTLDQQVCQTCHNQADPSFMAGHLAEVGPNCTGCHDGVDRMQGFEHAQVFPLDGAHAVLPCADCHAGQVFTGLSAACSTCHAEPEIHAGFFGLSCQLCHSTQAWTPAQLTAHGFPLDHGGQGNVSCQTCHPNTYVEYTCYGCHDHDPQQTAEKHQDEGISPAELVDCAGCHPNGLEEEAADD